MQIQFFLSSRIEELVWDQTLWYWVQQILLDTHSKSQGLKEMFNKRKSLFIMAETCAGFVLRKERRTERGWGGAGENPSSSSPILGFLRKVLKNSCLLLKPSDQLTHSIDSSLLLKPSDQLTHSIDSCLLLKLFDQLPHSILCS